MATNIVIGFVIAIVLTLSSQNRYWRIFAAVEWWVGITNVIGAYRGLFVLLQRLHTHNVRPWQSANGDHRSKHPQHGEEASLEDMALKYEDTTSCWPVKMEIFGPAKNYKGDPWVEHEGRKVSMEHDLGPQDDGSAWRPVDHSKSNYKASRSVGLDYHHSAHCGLNCIAQRKSLLKGSVLAGMKWSFPRILMAGPLLRYPERAYELNLIMICI